MHKSKLIALIAAGLVAGLVLGSVGFAYAAPADTTPANPVVASGLRLGQSIRDAGGRLIDILASLTGLSVDEVQAERADGKSVADIASANGVEVDAVVAKALEARKAILDAKVADGTITQDTADAVYAQMSERVAERATTDATGAPSWAGSGSGGRGMGGGGRGMGGGTGVCTAVTAQ